MSVLRPLPPRPSLEYEHKEAKALLRLLRAGDPDALARARARHPDLGSRVKLSDAQLVIAREYGFASWPRLVRYFGDVERQRHNHRSIQSAKREFYDSNVQRVLVWHRDRRPWVGRSLAAYVPRFYGVRVDDVFAAPIGEDDARLVVARERGFPSWSVLLEQVAAETSRRPSDWKVHPLRQAGDAMATGDLDRLQRVVDAHPQLLHPTEYEIARGDTLLRTAIDHEDKIGAAAMQPIVRWLEMHGHDRRRELNRQLCGHMYMTTEKVQRLLDAGADPSWLPPNGIPVLEHALVRYWNGAAVDLVAARTVPRKALWIAAGLGDVDGVRRFLDREGRPTLAARRLRPDFAAVSLLDVPSPPEPDDEDILMEALLVAVLNDRSSVVEYMASRGVSLNSVIWSAPIINLAVGNAWTPMVECLVRCGADLDLRGWQPKQSARELAREMFASNPDNPERRRIAALCGLDPDAILAERDARPVNPLTVDTRLRTALELAGDDAFRLGQPTICLENLLFGLLRVEGVARMLVAHSMGVRAERFRADFEDRLRPADDRVARPKLPLDSDAQAAIQAAISTATERRRDSVHSLHLLHALTRSDEGRAATLLAGYGASIVKLNTEIEGSS